MRRRRRRIALFVVFSRNERTNQTVRDLSTHFGLYVLQIGQKVVVVPVHRRSRRDDAFCAFGAGRWDEMRCSQWFDEDTREDQECVSTD